MDWKLLCVLLAIISISEARHCVDSTGRVVSSGEEFFDGCNWCKCGPVGVPSICTMNMCNNQPIPPVWKTGKNGGPGIMGNGNNNTSERYNPFSSAFLQPIMRQAKLVWLKFRPNNNMPRLPTPRMPWSLPTNPMPRAQPPPVPNMAGMQANARAQRALAVMRQLARMRMNRNGGMPTRQPSMNLPLWMMSRRSSNTPMNNLPFMGTRQMSSGSMGTRQMTPGGMGAGQMAPGAMGTGQMAPRIMGTGQVAPGGMGTGSMAPGGMGTGLMAPGGMGTGSMAPGGMGTGSMAPGGMGTGSMAPGGMGTGQMAPGIMGTGQMTPGEMGTGSMAPGGMGTGPMLPGGMANGQMTPGNDQGLSMAQMMAMLLARRRMGNQGGGGEGSEGAAAAGTNTQLDPFSMLFGNQGSQGMSSSSIPLMLLKNNFSQTQGPQSPVDKLMEVMMLKNAMGGGGGEGGGKGGAGGEEGGRAARRSGGLFGGGGAAPPAD